MSTFGKLPFNSSMMAQGEYLIDSRSLLLNFFFSITAIQARNEELRRAKLYNGQTTHNPQTANVRYELLPTESSRLYRKYSRMNGIDMNELPQYNVEYWLDRNSPSYKPQIAAAIFHYHARETQNNRLCFCIQTAEMKNAAWKHAHQGQLIMASTFGICSSRVLLFIALGVDEE